MKEIKQFTSTSDDSTQQIANFQQQVCYKRESVN